MIDGNLIERVQAVSKEIKSQWITIKSLLDGSYQKFKALDIEEWLAGDKLTQFKYFTFRCNNPYLTLWSKDSITLMLDKVYLTTDLPRYEEVGKEYFESLDENDVITVYYSNNWWEQCYNWKEVKAKLKRDRDK